MFFRDSDNLDALKSNEIPQSIKDLVRETLNEASEIDRNWAYFHSFVFSIPEFSLKKRLHACKIYIQLKGNDYSLVKRVISLTKSVLYRESNHGVDANIINESHYKQCSQILEAIAIEKFNSETTTFIIQSMAEIARSHVIEDLERKKTTGTISDCTRMFHDLSLTVLDKWLEESTNEAHQWDMYLLILNHLTPNIKNINRYISERAVKFLFDIQPSVLRWEEGIFLFVPQLVVKASTAKVDVRNITLVAITELFEAIEAQDHKEKLIHFFEVLLKNKEGYRRLFATECTCKILENCLKKLDPTQEQSLNHEFVSKFLRALMTKFSDKVSSIRTKAISGFLNVLKSGYQTEEKKEALFTILSSNRDEMRQENILPDESMNDINDSFTISDESRGLIIEKMISKKGIIGSRVFDNCSPVRKAAIQVITQLVLMYPEYFLKDTYLHLIKGISMDESLTNRKQALKMLDLLVETFPGNEYLYKDILNVMLILITDVETSVVNLALDIASRRFMKLIKKKDATLFNILENFTPSQLHRVKHLFSVMKKEKILKSRDLVNIQDYIINVNMNHVAAWILFDELTQYFPEEVDSLFIKETFEGIDRTPEEDRSTQQTKILFYCINILSKVCHLCDEAEQRELIENIGRKIVTFDVPPSLIHGYIATLSSISASSSNKRIQLFHQILNNDFYSMFYEAFTGASTASDQMLLRYLSTIGEAAVCFNQCNVPQKFITIVQGLLSTNISRSKESLNSSRIRVSPSVRALAFATLGKMCLTNESLSRSSEKIFIRELQHAQEAEVRNNILITLCDLCVQYSGVDRYVSRIAERMKDPSLLVRRNAISLLAHLLSEDYIKWNPVIFFRFASMVSNSDDHVSRTACHVISSILPRKQPHLLFNHFIETIFVLNRCREHEVYNQFPQTEAEAIQFSYPNIENDDRKTKLNRLRRYAVYKFLLNQLSEEDKLKLHGRLHSEILPDFSEGKIRNEVVLLDIFAILSSQDMKLNKSSTISEDEIDAAAHFSSQMVNEILKRHIRDNVLPVIVELKKSLERRRSPCLGNLLDYFHSISVLYPSEVQDLLKHDRQLRGEFEYDARRRQNPRVLAEVGSALKNRSTMPLPSLTSTAKKKKRSGFYEGPRSTPVRVLHTEFTLDQSPRPLQSPRLQSPLGFRSPHQVLSPVMRQSVVQSLRRNLDFGNDTDTQAAKGSTPISLQKTIFTGSPVENRRISNLSPSLLR